MNNEKNSLFLSKITLIKKSIIETCLFDLSVFENNLRQILKEHKCILGYQNRNSRKSGHMKTKINIHTNEIQKEIKIDRFETQVGKIYIVIHELTHLLNEHNKSRELSKKQCEVVADTVAMMYIKYYGMYDELRFTKMNKKWNVYEYSKIYIMSMSFSKKKEEIMLQQINKTYMYLKENL